MSTETMFLVDGRLLTQDELKGLPRGTTITPLTEEALQAINRGRTGKAQVYLFPLLNGRASLFASLIKALEAKRPEGGFNATQSHLAHDILSDFVTAYVYDNPHLERVYEALSEMIEDL